MGEVFIGLVHYPVLNKKGDIVATSVTNLDIHDIARLSKTYGVSKCFFINPMASQKRLVERIIEHWTIGFGMSYNPIRGEALKDIVVVESFEVAQKEVMSITGQIPDIVGTWAGHEGGYLSYHEMRGKIDRELKPYLILFGTGWGMPDEIKSMCTHILEPIRGIDDYNHLSVRTAAAIVLDRLRGRIESRGVTDEQN